MDNKNVDAARRQRRMQMRLIEEIQKMEAGAARMRRGFTTGRQSETVRTESGVLWQWRIVL